MHFIQEMKPKLNTQSNQDHLVLNKPIDSCSSWSKTNFVDILEIFSLEIGQISSHLLEKEFATWQHAFHSTNTTFYDIFARASIQKSKFRDTYFFRLFNRFNRSRFLFLLFLSFCNSVWPSTGLSSSWKNFWESISELLSQAPLRR